MNAGLTTNPGAAGWRRIAVTTPIAALLIALALAVARPARAHGDEPHGPGGEHATAPATGAPAGVLARLPDGSVSAPKEAQRRMGVRTQLSRVAQTAMTQELPGRVIVDPNAGGRVQSANGGRVEPGPRGLPVVGQRVRQGEVLAYVRPQADPYAQGSQQAQWAELRAERTVAEQRVQRLTALEGTVPRKEIDAARAELQSLQQREASIGRSLQARETLTAPVSGVIARAEVLAGQVVDARELLFEVVDPSRLLVEATTADASLADRIDSAQLQGVAEAKLRLLGAARVMRDGVLPLSFGVRAESAGAALPLAVGQPVTVIVASRERIEGVVLPAQAIVRSPANEPMVWVKASAELFVPQPVRVRPLDARTVVVTQGLAADQRVVVQGAALIAQIR